jgi:hypothetical protein
MFQLCGYVSLSFILTSVRHNRFNEDHSSVERFKVEAEGTNTEKEMQEESIKP